MAKRDEIVTFRFYDRDIESVTIAELTADKSSLIELGLKEETEAIELNIDDVKAMVIFYGLIVEVK